MLSNVFCRSLPVRARRIPTALSAQYINVEYSLCTKKANPKPHWPVRRADPTFCGIPLGDAHDAVLSFDVRASRV
jgi:hypothetical protein